MKNNASPAQFTDPKLHPIRADDANYKSGSAKDPKRRKTYAKVLLDSYLSH